MTESIEPRRGEVWLVGLGAARAGEPGKWRPAVVVSADELIGGGRFDLWVVVPLSASLTASAVRPQIPVGQGVDRESVASCRGIRGIARSRFGERLGSVAPATMESIDRALSLVMGLG